MVSKEDAESALMITYGIVNYIEKTLRKKKNNQKSHKIKEYSSKTKIQIETVNNNFKT